MDTYLQIAEIVLRAAKRPLTSRSIMNAAFRAGIVPSQLFGKAQHKTLHARLSEDILRHKLESRFFRTDPGCFFLSEFRSDPRVPDKYKDPFLARRRRRDLGKREALAVKRSYVSKLKCTQFDQWERFLAEADAAGALKYTDSKGPEKDLIFVWAFSIVRRDDQVLSYRIGKYRDDRGAFSNRKSVGFSELVGFEDVTLFSNDLGATECGLNAVLADLDLSRAAFGEQNIPQPVVSFAIVAELEAGAPVVLLVMEWECPVWFEPTSRRLSLNEVRWISVRHIPNDYQQFEPWSAAALAALIERADERFASGKANFQGSG